MNVHQFTKEIPTKVSSVDTDQPESISKGVFFSLTLFENKCVMYKILCSFEGVEFMNLS